MKLHFADRAEAFRRGVENVESAVVPPAARPRTPGRIPAFSRDAPDRTGKRRRRDRFDCVDKSAVSALAGTDHVLKINLVFEAIDDAQDVDGPVLMDKIDGPFSVQLRVSRIEPCSNLVGCVEIPEASDNIVKIGQNEFVSGPGFDIVGFPAGNGRLGNPGDIGDIGSLEPAGGVEFVKESWDCFQHRFGGHGSNRVCIHVSQDYPMQLKCKRQD